MKTTVEDIRALVEKREKAAYERGQQAVRDEIAQALDGGRRKTRRTSRPTVKFSKKKLPSRKQRKNPWANMTPEQKLERVNAIRKGRGLPPRKSLDD